MVKSFDMRKRQLLFAFFMMHRYLRAKHLPPSERAKLQKRVFIVSGKAKPKDENSKLVIQLINNIARLFAEDTELSGVY